MMPPVPLLAMTIVGIVAMVGLKIRKPRPDYSSRVRIIKSRHWE